MSSERGRTELDSRSERDMPFRRARRREVRTNPATTGREEHRTA